MPKSRQRKPKPKKRRKKISPTYPKVKFFTAKRIALLSLIFTIVCAIPTWYLLSDRNRPQESKDEDNFQQGVLQSDPIQASETQYKRLESPPIFKNQAFKSDDPEIIGILLDSISLRVTKDVNNPFRPPSGTWFTFGRASFNISISDLKNGIEVSFPISNAIMPPRPECGNSTIRFGVYNNRLYISCKLYDIEKQEYIGEIEYNHWKVYIPNRLRCWSDDKRLEIRDKQDNIVISLKYGHPKTDSIPYLSVGGYFINNMSVIVVPNYPTMNVQKDCLCFPKSGSDWKVDALSRIDSLLSVFPEKAIPKPK